MQIAKLSDGQKTIIEFIIPYLKNSKVILLDCLDAAGPEYQFILNNLKNSMQINYVLSHLLHLIN